VIWWIVGHNLNAQSFRIWGHDLEHATETFHEHMAHHAVGSNIELCLFNFMQEMDATCIKTLCYLVKLVWEVTPQQVLIMFYSWSHLHHFIAQIEHRQ